MSPTHPLLEGDRALVRWRRVGALTDALAPLSVHPLIMRRGAWALDLGTTNTALAVWDESAEEPRLVELDSICRRPDGNDPLEAPRLVPTVLEFRERLSLVDKLGAWPPLTRHFFLGRLAHIGRSALERNLSIARPAWVPGFKSALAADPLRPLARLGRRSFTARQAARTFLRELLAETRRVTGHRIRDLVVTVPVDAYESYRAELQAILRSLGIRKVRFLDEPLAAAFGYGLSLDTSRTVLVVDMGGGTMHLALLEIEPAGVREGRGRVLAKEGRAVGGNAVDGWIVEDVCRQVGFDLADLGDDEEMRLWRRLMLAEACRVKERAFFHGSAEFLVMPPGQTRRIGGRAEGIPPICLDKGHLTEILRAGGFYTLLAECVEALFGSQGARPEDVQDVLLVGGSTLLPGVYSFFEERFGRHRLRAWQPFEAVAHGAASFAAERFVQSDFIVHDYAFLTHDPKTNEPRHTVVVPKGTRFPTRPDLWKGRVVPTCPLGEPETLFKLVICEVGKASGARRFVWDAAGDLRKLGGKDGDGRVIVPLNESNPALGTLAPPHRPGDRKPRLEVAFGVNDDRWLVATVLDLQSRERLMDEEPVVRLQ